MAELMPLQDARRQIFEAVRPLAPIELPLAEAHGCVAAGDVATEYDIPPFSSAEIEGVAVRAADVVGAAPETPVALRVSGWARAGRPPEATVGWGEAVRVGPGAPLPAGADCIVPTGGFDVEAQEVKITVPVAAGTNVRPAGEDIAAGTVLVPGGRRLSGGELGILATAGYGSVLAHPKVRVGVISTGELVEPGRPTSFGQVRDANSYLILGALRELGAVPYRIGIVRDVEAELGETLESNLARVDAVVCSGSVTEDLGDGLSTLLAGIGDVRTYRVAMHPGSTVVFGTVGGRPFFSLSGEPLAAWVSFEILVRPAFLRMMGRRDVTRPEVTATLDAAASGPAGMILFVPARIRHHEGAWHARPTGPPSPSRLGGAAQANGLVVVPAGETELASGSRVRVQIFRPLER